MALAPSLLNDAFSVKTLSVLVWTEGLNASKYTMHKQKRIDLNTFLKVDQNENAIISHKRGRSKTNQNVNDDQRYRRHVCVQHVRRAQLTSQREILSFSNV